MSWQTDDNYRPQYTPPPQPTTWESAKAPEQPKSAAETGTSGIHSQNAPWNSPDRIANDGGGSKYGK